MSALPSAKLMMAGAAPLKPQDVFTTFLINAGSNGQVVNGQDWQTSGGLVWAKTRQRSADHYLLDTSRSNNLSLISNFTSAEANINQSITPRIDGFSFTNLAQAGENNVLWSFRRAKKFFDIATYTGTGDGGRRAIPHSLGDVPGMVIVKARSASGDWRVRHRGASGGIVLNSTAAQGSQNFEIPDVSADTFTVQGSSLNSTGVQYVAYLFAHNPDLIDCGSYVGNGAFPGQPVTCGSGWAPQFLMIKNASNAGGWYMLDTKRGINAGNEPYLFANTSDAEFASSSLAEPTATGFRPNEAANSTGRTYIYLAIRSPT